MKILSPSTMRLKKPLKICAKVLNSLGCKSVHIDVSLGDQLPGFYGKEMLVSGDIELFDCPATIHIFSDVASGRLVFGSIRKSDRIMLHVFPHTSQNQIVMLLEDSARMGFEVALALDLASDVDVIIPFINDITAIYIMGIPVATHGLPPSKSTQRRMRLLKELIQLRNPACLIGIDGGINQETFTDIAALADEIVIGGLLFNAPNVYLQWEALNVLLRKIDGGVV